MHSLSKWPWHCQEKIFTIYHCLYRSDVARSRYAQISSGHSINTNSAVNSQSVILILLSSIDVQTEGLFLTKNCRYTAWKHVENSFSSNLSTLNVRSPYTYIRNLIKHQRIHNIQNAIISHARCLEFRRVHKTAKRDYYFRHVSLSVLPHRKFRWEFSKNMSRKLMFP